MWHHDEATGLMTNKVYADGKGPTYAYTPDGKLARRTWARGVATDYAYDSQGLLVSKNYSDSTPDVSLTYDRLGHTLSAICAGVSTNLYVYNRLGQLTNEVQNGTTIARTYDTLGRETGYALGGAGVSPADVGTNVEYGYDNLGRFASVTSGDEVFTYGYVPGSSLVGSVANNHGLVRTTTYEPHRNLISTVHNHYGSRTISRFDYTNDEIGRRIARVDSGEAFSETAFERYSYNDRSEVTGSQRFYGSDIDDLSRPVTGRTFGYGYDPIGNRVSSFEDAGGERLTTTYTANELNQYTAIQNAGAVPLRGDAKREAVVTVNGDRAERDNGTASFTPWSYSLPSDDTTAHYQNANVLAVAQNAVGEDVEQRESGSLFVPAAETFLTYDDDGNMTFDGRFRYSWNGENRMIRAEEDVAPTNRAPTIITYAYDEKGRMVSKNIAGTNSTARSLLWDGYNIVREIDNGIETYNVWGLDLDGTLQGCGGVGGLLAVAKTNGFHITLYDANGNVSGYVSATGSISAHYEYSPFGEPFTSQGTHFTYQFSTKPYCISAKLSEYQLRKYNGIIGRWMSQDQMHELYEISKYSICANNTIANIDLLGLLTGDEASSIGSLEDIINVARTIAEETDFMWGLMRWGRFTARTGGIAALEYVDGRSGVVPSAVTNRVILTPRYLYTCRCGMIDFLHFFQLMYLSIIGSNDSAVKRGIAHENESRSNEPASYYAPEDITSNALGAYFGTKMWTFNTVDSFIEELGAYLKKCDPIDWKALSETQRNEILSSYDMNIDPDDKRRTTVGNGFIHCDVCKDHETGFPFKLDSSKTKITGEL